MGGKSNVSSFGGSNSARHLMTHNKHHDGVEAPRNSLDLPLETANRHHVINENLMVKIPFPETNLHHKGSTPVKLLINEEVTDRESTKRGGPSVVARLMGMDTLPPKKGQTIHVKECFEENPKKHISRVPRFVSTKSEVDTPSLATFTQSKEQLPPNYNKQRYSSSSAKSLSSAKSHRREHPQEELLQKFKKEFESWQASKLWECSSNLDQHDNSQGLKNEQNLALENLNMEKMTRYANTNRNLVQKKPKETDVHTSVNKVKIASNQVDGLCYDASLDKQCVPRMKDERAMRKLASNSFEPVSRAKFQEKKSRSCSPTRIVILKPSSDINEIEEPPSEALEKGNSMEHFLEEVKERLRLEMEGKGRNDSVRRGNAAHTSLHERSTDPKQLARDIAKHIRESVTRDLGATSVRSESIRSYRNDFHVNEQESQDSIKKDTRKFISDRLKNVLKDDTEFQKPMFNDGRVGNSLLIKEKERSKSMTDFSKEGKGASFWEDKKAVNESIPKYLRREQVKMAEFDADAMSPPNLIRSFSAPASGTSFGKLLLEDHHVATRAQISRMHETSENDSALINKNKKDGFNFKGRVSIFRRNLSFKGKIFGKKMSSIGESTSETFSYLKSIETMPSVIRNFGMVEDNSTEVPPSPASFYSSPINEHHSPVSPLEVPFVEDHSSTQVSGELSMTLLESGIQPEQIESKVSEEVATEAQLNDINEIMHIESHAKSYVRDILTVSGLHKAWPLDQILLRLDGQIESISSCVFDELEEKNCKLGKVDANCCKLSDIDMDRKLLFDLVNEALPTVIGSPMTPLMSKSWKESLTQLPCGIKLLDDLFHQIKIYANHKVVQHQSIDKVVAWDVKLRPWFTSSYEDIGFVEKKVEGLIIGELIDELVSDLFGL